MLELLSDPYTWFLIALSIVLCVGIGRLQHKSGWSIGLNVLAFNAFVHGLRLSASIGGEALLAAAMASGAYAIWAELDRRHRTRTAEDVVESQA